MKAFMLESLREEQDTLVRLMERAHGVAEVMLLDWALETVVQAWRDLRADRIGWQEAVRRYQAASSAELDCEMARIVELRTP